MEFKYSFLTSLGLWLSILMHDFTIYLPIINNILQALVLLVSLLLGIKGLYNSITKKT